MANIDPNKLVRNFEVVTHTPSELRLYWDSPRSESDLEEVVVVRRKDAFPVEIRNRNFEDRYTDVAQVEVFRGSPIYCSHLIPNGSGVLAIAGDNAFTPAMSEFSRDNNYKGRLIRDSLSQVFRITGNTEDELYYESISTNPDNQVIPTEGAFVILADFAKERRSLQTLSLLPDSATITILANSFTGGDSITLNNSVTLNYASEWSAGATVEDTAQNLLLACQNSGVKYKVTRYGATLLLQKSEENSLSVTSTAANAEVIDYGAARGKVFINNTVGNIKDNELNKLVIQEGNLTFNHIKSNSGLLVELYTSVIVAASDVHVLDSHANTFPSGFIDTYGSQIESIRKDGKGLESDVYYYYTAFTTPITSISVTYNEEDPYGENPLPYTVDKVASYYMRVFYEDIKYANMDVGEYTYDSGTGAITFTDGRDLSGEDILVGYLFADNLGQRYSIVDVSNLASGSFNLATGLTVGTDPQTPLHGAITVANTPVGYGSILVGDTFKDIAGNSFQIYGTNTDPLGGLPTPPSHSFDVGQGLIDTNLVVNPFLVPYSYDPTDGAIQYGELPITQNTQLSPYTYTSGTGIISYTTNIELGDVEVGHTFVDGVGNYFEILTVDAVNLKLGLAAGLTIDTTVANRRSGSVISEVGFTDEEGNLLVDLAEVKPLDLFKTNSKADYVVLGADASEARLFIEPNLDSLATIVETEFDGSVYRRGNEVTWIGFEGENAAILNSSNLGAVRRYSSVNDVQFAYASNPLSTQAFAISAAENDIVRLLYKWWPSVFRDLDETGDLEDLMGVFGYKFNEIYSLISTYELQNADLIVPKYLDQGYRNRGMSVVSESLGIDTRRRVMKDIVSCWKLKGSREGLAKYIKVLTTWDVTNGTGDLIRAIQDSSQDLVGLRHYSAFLGNLNTEFVDTTNVKSPPAGRFVKGLPGFNLAGFFDVVEIQIELPNVALHTGNSTNVSYVGSTSILQHSGTDFGGMNNLKGCFVIPIEGSPNDYYEILANDSDTLTVQGSIPFSALGNKYVVLSPLNLNRFVALQRTIVEQLSYRSVPVFNFTIKTI